MGKVVGIEKAIKEKKKYSDLNKPIEFQLAETNALLMNINKQLLDKQARLIDVIENQNFRIQCLSESVGRIEDHFAEQVIYFDEFDMSELEEE